MEGKINEGQMCLSTGGAMWHPTELALGWQKEKDWGEKQSYVGEEKKHGMALETGKGKSFGGNDKWVQLLVLFHSHEGNGSLHGSRATDMSH